MTSNPSLGRRRLLQAGAALGLGVAGGLASVTPARAESRDYALRATYDWAEAYFTEHGEAQPDRPNEFRGSLAWGQSYILRSYLAMYEAFRDERYLDLLCRNVDAILSIRDSERGVTDWRGESLPVWRGWAPYTAGDVDIPGTNGTPVLRLRTAQSYADGVTADVTHESEDRFTVTMTDTRIDRSDTFTDLTMDATSPDFAVTRIHDANPTATRATAVDLRSDNSPAMPEPGSYTMASHYVTFSVHTGMIVAPIAEFCHLVRKNPRLMRRYGAKAAKYLRAVRDAVAVHDHEWRQNDQGEGWYVWEKGTPLAFDGCEMPHNQFLALATAQAYLAALVDDGPYREHAVRMLTTFRNDLQVQDDSYVWKYWWTKGHVHNGYSQADDVSEWTPAYNGARQIEDGSHGAISIEAALAGYRLGLVFDETDMRRFAATYTDNLMHYDDDGEAHVWYRVDGTANLGLQDLQAPRWANLASWDERIFTHAREIFNREQPEPLFGSYLLSTAFLAAHNRE
ncbi:hypothetical protein [Phytoactinopolyspora endophytica]|uniref:hypothetical protein n=1 Tax=Phytoactinopolyspora endophytica TaxID=1642495 RepID=UPI00101CF1C9|nr:hypothetical protein [Phytoactinopolyspora endophytica]